MIDLYRDRPDLYDLLHDEAVGDLAFYAGIAGALALGDGLLLELGCGSGRVLEALLRQHPNLHAVGLDAEPAMLTRAQQRLAPFAPRATLVQGDMRYPELGEQRFDLIVVAVNTFMHLEDHAAQRACLEAIRAHLHRDGAAIIDLANPFHALTLPQGAITLRRHLHDNSARLDIVVSGALEVDPAAPHVIDHLFFDEMDEDGALRRLLSRVELRLVFMPELELLLAAANLGIADAYGDYDLGPYTATSERMIVVIRPYS